MEKKRWETERKKKKEMCFLQLEFLSTSMALSCLRQLYTLNSPCYDAVYSLYGSSIRLADSTVNRQSISRQSHKRCVFPSSCPIWLSVHGALMIHFVVRQTSIFKDLVSPTARTTVLHTYALKAPSTAATKSKQRSTLSKESFDL